MVDGALVYVTAGGLLMGARVDIERGKVLGTSVLRGDNLATNASTGLARAALSPAGTLIYQTGALLSRVVIVGPNGRTRLGLEDNRDYTFPRLSPHRKRLALSIGTAGSRDVWVYELGAGTLTRITTSGPANERAERSPDGKRVLYRADQGGRVGSWWRPLDLSVEATPLVRGKEIDIFEGVISPDGRWIAFVTNESGRDEIVVQPFPGPGGRVQVSTSGGTEPLWSRDGRKLFYRGSGHLMAAIVRPGPTFDIVARDSALTDIYLYALNPHPNYDVLPDGAHFIFLEASDAGEMTVAANWLPVPRSRMTGGTGRWGPRP